VWSAILVLTLASMQHEHGERKTDPDRDCFFGGLEDMGPHMKMTPLREAKAGDRERADEIVESLKKSLKKYADHQAALADGYRIFLPRVPLPEHHFTNYAYAAREAFEFDATRPSSLLYRKKGDGYELAGAMFTAPLGVGLEELDRRVPLSVAQWHLHSNVCLPPQGKGLQMLQKNPRFGLSPEASIATEEECTSEGGRFYRAVFGWMVHVYPFDDDPEAVFRHPGHHDHAIPGR
jgi:hypothetical protein